jgi:hypothetical protein
VEAYGFTHAQIGNGVAADNTLVGPGHRWTFFRPVIAFLPQFMHK